MTMAATVKHALRRVLTSGLTRRSSVVLTGLCVGLALQLPGAVVAQPARPFVFGTPSSPSSPLGKWMRQVYTEALRRMGMQIEVVEAPLKRLALMTQNGSIDGEFSRTPAYAAEHPEMVKVETSLLSAVFSFYAVRPMPELGSVEAVLRGQQQVIYHRGVVGCEKLLQGRLPAERLNVVTSTAHGLEMLRLGRAQLFCEVSSEMFNERLSHSMSEHKQLYKLFDAAPPVPLNAYVLAKHADFAVRLGTTLKQMKAEGLVDRYLREALQ
ncbi:hypothetical protein RQP53_10600 [Paucibacter sp. APW11]|uniref:Solute-binding protein family 3/N-terminal domain-containing protein n=1 Tax=Roseateles aquae TaxID=3077235 RepID=A0ABU3PCW1_9BURK|nr:hypothetical protein [Paucibacter sp. APW11]MDT8999716.1 hypothetical protein [Paucibacter sp. APW11]